MKACPSPASDRPISSASDAMTLLASMLPAGPPSTLELPPHPQSVQNRIARHCRIRPVLTRPDRRYVTLRRLYLNARNLRKPYVAFSGVAAGQGHSLRAG